MLTSIVLVSCCCIAPMLLTFDHAGDDISEIVVHVVLVATVVGLPVHLNVLNDNVESISFDRTCCR